MHTQEANRKCAPHQCIEWKKNKKNERVRERERIECAGNQHLNHMHHIERRERAQNRYALTQIKTDPHNDKETNERRRAREKDWKKGSTMIFFRFLFVPSFHLKKEKKSHKFRSSYFLFFFWVLSFHLRFFHICTVFILQNDVIKIKCVQADYHLCIP